MAKLTAAKRQSLPASDFARPGKGEGPKGAGSGSFPIPDANHARKALQLSGDAPDVVAKVHAKFPQIAAKDGGPWKHGA
jgi:hypothetical protein